MITRQRFATFLLVGTTSVLASMAYGQTNSNSQAVQLSATLGETITVSATPATASFTLVAGGTATATPVSITTTWVVGASRSTVELDGYFASASAALTDGNSNDISSAQVLGLMASGSLSSYTAFTATTAKLGPSGASLILFSQTLTTSNLSATRTDNLTLKIDLSSTPQLPAGTYTGTLTLQAQAF